MQVEKKNYETNILKSTLGVKVEQILFKLYMQSTA